MSSGGLQVLLWPVSSPPSIPTKISRLAMIFFRFAGQDFTRWSLLAIGEAV